MFMGEYHHTLDTKGRLVLPAKFRNELGEHAVATRGMDGCIFIFPESAWLGLQSRLDTLPLTKQKARQFSRFFYASATELELDRQGRIKLSDTLIDFADLTKNCVILGVSKRLEIWSETKWEQLSLHLADDVDAVSEDLFETI